MKRKMSKLSMHSGVFVLGITSFAIGVAEFVVVGILPAISIDFKVSLAKAGSLVGLYALVLAIGTPFIILALSRFSRKPVLLALVLIFLLGNLFSAIATSYNSLLIGRIITALAHGSFFAIGATVAADLAPKGQASKAIAIMFAGLTLAMIIGVPLGSLLGNSMGWRLPFYMVSIFALFALLATTFWLPNIPTSNNGSTFLVQLIALKNPAILSMMLVTVLGFGASFATFTFITPILTDISGFSSNTANLLLVVFGVATMLGNLAGGKLADSIGWQKSLRLMFVSLTVVMVILTQSLHSPIAMVPLLFIWGIIAFGMTPAFQAGMLATAERYTPQAVAFASALNISAFNLGITFGETFGSKLVEQGNIAATPWVGVVAAILVQLPLAWLVWRANIPVNNQ